MAVISKVGTLYAAAPCRTGDGEWEGGGRQVRGQRQQVIKSRRFMANVDVDNDQYDSEYEEWNIEQVRLSMQWKNTYMYYTNIGTYHFMGYAVGKHYRGNIIWTPFAINIYTLGSFVCALYLSC